jgi:hypothetical protein
MPQNQPFVPKPRKVQGKTNAVAGRRSSATTPMPARSTEELKPRRPALQATAGRGWSKAYNSFVPRFWRAARHGLNGCTNRCTRTSLRCPMKPTVADSRTPNRLILRGPAGDLPQSRQRPRVRVPSSPPFFSKDLRNGWFDWHRCRKVQPYRQ